MSSLRIAHTSRDRSASGAAGITNEAFAQSSVSLYKRISSTENLTAITDSPRMSTSVLTVPTGAQTGSTSPKGSNRNSTVAAAAGGPDTSQTQNSSSPGSSNSSTTYYQHQVHNHLGPNELIAIKSKFEAEFRRFSLQRSDITSLDDFMKMIEHFHKLFSIPFNLFYADPVHGDLLPINNDVNFGLAISSAKPLLRLFVQRKDGTLGYIPISSNVNAKKNFLGTLLPSSSSSNSSKPRLAISAPEDFRQVSSIIDVDIVPDTCRRVRLVKHGSDKPLGFYIRDGTSVRVTAHGVEKVPGIFISRLIPGGLAESTGLLAVNDEVLEVNGIEVNGKSLDQVTDMMVANSSNLIITIRPANQRGHSTLSGSFSSNTISTSAPSRADPHGYHHSGHQTNSLERGAHRPKKSMAPPPPVQADFHNPHHPVHYGGASVSGIGTNPGGAFESLHRSAAHRHSASIIPGHHHSSSSSQHHFHHEPMSYHQFNSNRHSVIGGPGMAEGVKMNAGPLGNSLHHHQGASVLHHDDSSDDDDEDEVRDHFTTSLVINSPHEPSVFAAAPSGGSVSSLPVKSNGQLHNTTVIINTNPSASTSAASQHIHHHNMTISSATVPVNRTNSNLSNSQGAAAASSAAAFIRNSLRGKNGNLGGGGGPSSHVTSKSFSNVPLSSQQQQQQHQDRSHYAHLFHHSENALLHHQHQQQQQQQANRSRSQSSSASSSPTILTKQHVSTNPSVASGSKGAGSSADSDIVTL